MIDQQSSLTRRQFIASTALAAGGLTLASFATAQSPRSGGVLRVAFESDITGGDPYTSRGIQAGYVADNLYNNLVTIDDQLNILPDLAESWDVEEGGQTGRPRCRQGFPLPGRPAGFLRDDVARRQVSGATGGARVVSRMMEVAKDGCYRCRAVAGH